MTSMDTHWHATVLIALHCPCVMWTPLLSSLWADVIVERCCPLGTYRIHTSDFMLCGKAFGEKKNQGHGETTSFAARTNLHSCQRATGTMPLFSRGSRKLYSMKNCSKRQILTREGVGIGSDTIVHNCIFIKSAYTLCAAVWNFLLPSYYKNINSLL